MKFLKIFFILSFFSITNFVFALDAPQNVVLKSSTNSSLEISWDKVEWVWAYAVSYWKNTGSGWVYDHELEILVDETATTVINNLESETKYYIAVKAYESDISESEYSSEVSFETTVASWEELKINNLDLVDTRNLIVRFNINLDEKSLVNLNIVNNNNIEEIELEKYEIEDNYLKLFLNNDLTLWSEYSITIITLDWINWETINDGVDWIYNFLVNEDTKVYVDENTWDNILNSAGTEPIIDTTDTNKVLGWEKIKTNVATTVKTAKDKSSLPTTGPTETFLFLIFSFISGLLFIRLRKKTTV